MLAVTDPEGRLYKKYVLSLAEEAYDAAGSDPFSADC
jgi:hypothetical protein